MLWEAVYSGHEVHVSLALQKLSKDLNKPNASIESFPIHLAAWRNSVVILEKLLEAGADPNTRDGESGWTALHKAVYFGNLSVAATLLLAGASTEITDHKGRTPLDLLTQELRLCLEPGAGTRSSTNRTSSSVSSAQSAASLYSWGCGANYQLGTGSRDFHECPVRMDSLHEHGVHVVSLAAAKYHSAAVDAAGRLYTWGWGRGGRLGHPDSNIHSGDSALIHPWVVSGLGKRQVVGVAAAKHHMLVCTSGGEVFSWGSNKDGKLGYAGVDTQPTPKKIAAFKHRVTAVAAANRHSAAITAGGEVYTWGANDDGQLGYGTSDSGSNTTPRLVDALKGKTIISISAAKRHTVVLTTEGEPYTWGHTVVTPRRVQLAGCRDITRSVASSSATGGFGATGANNGSLTGGSFGEAASGSSAAAAPGLLELSFHRGHNEVARPFAVEVAAGYTHTSVITRSGAVLLWHSADPQLKVKEVTGSMAGKRVVGLSASKYRTMASTELGDVYFWEVPKKEVHLAKSGGGGQHQDGSLKAGSTGVTSRRPQHGGRSCEQPVERRPVFPQRVAGIRRVSQVSVGDKHSLALVSWTVPSVPGFNGGEVVPASKPSAVVHKDYEMEVDEEEDELHLEEEDMSPGQLHWMQQESRQGQGEEGCHSSRAGPVESLQMLCQLAVAKQLVEPRTALQILEYADVANAYFLRTFCISLALQNLDIVMMEARYAFEVLPPHLLAELELQYKRWLAPLPTLGASKAGVGENNNVDIGASEALTRRGPMRRHSGVSGGSPPLGSSPILGSWMEQMMNHMDRGDFGAAELEGLLLPGSFNADDLDSLARSPVGELSGSRSRVGASSSSEPRSTKVQKKLQSKLQPGRRPTCAPAWLAGTEATEKLLPQIGARVLALEQAAAAALGAIGHAPTLLCHAASSATAADAGLSTSGLAFRSSQGQAAAEAEEESSRLTRNVHKKLQQIAALSAAHDGGAQLDGQQLAKLGQRLPMLEALQALESNAPLEEVKQMLAHAQEVAAKWIAAHPSANPLAEPPTPTRQPSYRPSSSKAVKQKGNKQKQQQQQRQQEGSKQQLEEPGADGLGQMSAIAGMASTSAADPLAAAGEGHSRGAQKVAMSPALHINPLSLPPPIVGFNPMMLAGGGARWPIALGPGGATAAQLFPIAAAAGAASSIGKAGSTASTSYSTPASQNNSGRPAARKGGLSEFLAGNLDKAKAKTRAAVPKAPPPPPKPAWGGVAGTRGATKDEGIVCAGAAGVYAEGAGPRARGADSSTARPPLPPPPADSASEEEPSRWLVLGPQRKAAPVDAVQGSTGGSKGGGAGGPAQQSSDKAKPPASATATSLKPPSASLSSHLAGGAASNKVPSASVGTNSLSLAHFMVQRKPAPPQLCTPEPKASSKALPWGGGGVQGSSPTVSDFPSQSKKTEALMPPIMLKDIQEEQTRLRGACSRSSGKGGGSSFSGGAASSFLQLYGTSPKEGGNKWYVPDQLRPQQLQFIQTEESAIKEISKLYGKDVTVRIVHHDVQKAPADH